MGIVLHAIPAHIVIFRGHGAVQIDALQPNIPRFQHLLYRDHADSRPTVQCIAEHAAHAVKSPITAHPQQPLAYRYTAQRLFENDYGTRLCTSHPIVTGLLRLLVCAYQLLEFSLRLNVKKALLVSHIDLPF